MANYRRVILIAFLILISMHNAPFTSGQDDIYTGVGQFVVNDGQIALLKLDGEVLIVRDDDSLQMQYVDDHPGWIKWQGDYVIGYG